MTRYWIAIGVMAAILALLSSSLPLAAQDSAQEPPIGQALTWPCESRFVIPAAGMAQEGLAGTALEWPCESRFVAMTGRRAEPELAYSYVLWPCESRFVGPVTEALPAELTTTSLEWPCESRFVATIPVVVTAPTLLGPHMTQEEANKEFYRLALQSFFETGDEDALLAYYPAELAEAHAAEWSAWRDAFSELTVTLDFQIAEGDRVLNCWTFQGAHTGEYMGIPPTGHEVVFMGLYAGRIDEGKIVEEALQVDRYGLLQQMGAMPVQGL